MSAMKSPREARTRERNPPGNAIQATSSVASESRYRMQHQIYSPNTKPICKKYENSVKPTAQELQEKENRGIVESEVSWKGWYAFEARTVGNIYRKKPAQTVFRRRY